jgi:hypothetical protein
MVRIIRVTCRVRLASMSSDDALEYIIDQTNPMMAKFGEGSSR